MCILHGVTIAHVEAIPIIGLLKSGLVKPTALNIALLGALSSPLVTKDENFTPQIGLDYSFTSVLNEVGMEEQLTGGSYSNQTYKRALAEKFFLNNSDIEEIENQVIIYQPQRIIVDQE